MAAKGKPTVTRAERSAATVKKILKIAAERVPELKAPHEPTSRRIRGHRTVPKKFIRSVSAAVDDIEERCTRRVRDFGGELAGETETHVIFR